MPEFERLQSALGLCFRNEALLKQALTHSSYLNENPEAGQDDNERMEFLGDAILNMVVAERIFHDYPGLPEGRLTEIRVALTRQEKLAEKATAIKLGEHLLLGRGEAASGGRNRGSNLANTLEALIAALFLDQGIEAARSYIVSIFQADLQEIKAGQVMPNFKALLQELTQAEFRILPEYEVIESTGPDHDREFHVAISLRDVMLAIGTGKSKKAAESHAARLAYEKLRANPDFRC